MAASPPTRLNVVAYLTSCFFSIAFLVFLNATQSFVITVLLHVQTNIGDYVGTLGFVDELVSVVMCPLWGTLSDKIGTRPVCAVAYVLVGAALVAFVHPKEVYPDLFFLRCFFALGGSGTASMVTALLADISASRQRNGKLAGAVGLCTGLGAVLAVTVFLPLPSRLESHYNMAPDTALRRSFYLVGSIAVVVGAGLFLSLKRDDSRSLRDWLSGDRAPDAEPKTPYFELLLKGFTAAAEPDIFVAYAGGLVARAASVAVSLFIPLFVNQWFYATGICTVGGVGDDDVKHSCRDAYVRSAILTGVSETCAIIAAPLWGLACDRAGKIPSLSVSAVIGAIAFFGFSSLTDPRAGIAFVWAILIGIAQIGAIVCSLALCTEKRTEYSGSIAGVYSVTGAAGILILTKVGGWASDHWRGAPFVIMALFNLIMLGCALRVIRDRGYFSEGFFLSGPRSRWLTGVDSLAARVADNVEGTQIEVVAPYADDVADDHDEESRGLVPVSTRV
ncbi:major facilitator superfamily domain-containing protein [Limtongia smithiae]|uniref:major facilitator superfamily domain-containing protein n=1 Tax=Limtongia smithiae TaxID=1125753 RepID=UPI0034CF7BE7